VVSTIASANSSAYSAVASLLSNAASVATTDTPPATSSATPDSTGASASHPVDSVNLSDRAKATLARAKADQVVADTLSAQLAAARDPDAKNPARQKSSVDITVSFDRLAGISASDDTPPSGVTTPEVNFMGGLRAGGFTISAKGSATTKSSEIDIIGPKGFSFMDKVFGNGTGAAGEFTGGSAGAGMIVSDEKVGNKEFITVSEARATASVVATGNSVQSVASAQSRSTMFVVDFSTGQISVLQNRASSAAISTGGYNRSGPAG
jgi:hypothetical protein